MKKQWVFGVLAVLLVGSLAAAASVAAEDIWPGGALAPGQKYVYDLFAGIEGQDGQGHVTILVQEGTDDQWALVISGELFGESFEFAVQAAAYDVDDLFFSAAMAMFSLPEPVVDLLFSTLWFPWYEVPWTGVPLALGWEFSDVDSWGDSQNIAIRQTCTQGPFSGYFVEAVLVDYGEEFFLDICIDLHVPMPVSVWSSGVDGDGHMQGTVAGARLVSYESDAAAVELPALGDGFEHALGTFAVTLEWKGDYDLDLELWSEDFGFLYSASSLGSPDIFSGYDGSEWIVFKDHGFIDLSTGRWILSPYLYGPDPGAPLQAVVTLYWPDGSTEVFLGRLEYESPLDQWLAFLLDVDAQAVEVLDMYLE